MSDDSNQHQSILRQIETCDQDIVRALDRRAEAYEALGELRENNPDAFIARPARADVIGAQQEASKQLSDPAVEAIFREVISACEQLIEPQRVAFLGSEGAFAHVAAIRHFGRSGSFQAYTSTSLVLDEVSSERAAYGVLPFETSADGGVTDTLNGLASSEARMIGELTIPCSYYLVSATGNPADVETVYGAPHAVGACELFIRTHFPKATVIDVPSCEVALAFACDDHGAAAVATEAATGDAGLTCIQERIEDHSGQEVRFAIVGRSLPRRTGRDRTVVAVAASDTPGALSQSLKPFADRGVNLTRVESRPVRDRAWRYLFFIELDGHVTDRRVLTALEEVRACTSFVRVLGSFARPE